MSKTLITNALMVNEGTITEGDLLISGGRIEKIAGQISADGAEVVDAKGSWLLPGMIDDQVHFREPGMPHKADMGTESRAAVAGGITTYMDMPNTSPKTTTREALERKFDIAATKSAANYSFYMGATNTNLEDVQRLDPLAACGIKVFMGASTGNMLVDSPDILDAIFRDAPTLIATHCEDSPTIFANEAAARAKYGEDVPVHLHPHIRSVEACFKSSSLAVGLARKHGSRLHVLHISTAKELEHFTAGPIENKRITGEACVHFFAFDERDYAELGTKIKCNPAIKAQSDREALIAAVRDDVIDVIATDHAPHTAEEKANTYFKAPSGLPLVQHALVQVLELVHDGHLSLEKAVAKVTHAPATLFNIAERGYLREGYFADLALVAPNDPWVVRPENVRYKVGWSPYEGRTFRSKVLRTWVNGQLAYDGQTVTDRVLGQRLQFNR